MENSSVTPEQIDVQTGDVSASDISDDTSNSDDIPTKEISPLNESQPDKEEAITPDLITGIEHSSTQVQKTESSTTSLEQNIIDDDTAETLDFVEMKHKEHVSKEIMERIREKKLCNQNSSLDSTSSEPSYENQNLKSSLIVLSYLRIIINHVILSPNRLLMYRLIRGAKRFAEQKFLIIKK